MVIHILRNTLILFNHWWLNTTHWGALSLYLFAKLLILTRAISRAFFLGQIYSASTFIMCSWHGAVVSHDNCNGYMCSIARSRCGFPLQLSTWLLSLCPLSQNILLLWFRVSTTTCFVNCLLRKPLPLLQLWFSFVICFKLCFSCSKRYSILHLFYAIS